ncbi:MAG: phenylalanine--tRNA ligase beta subunit-related protein, partial [Candidatus Thermoplasmatota archaeon]|nr:phenylalanine--tRNA ligase beta subunit-related protein [Candidatus Thermoplasmatota archaeon]
MRATEAARERLQGNTIQWAKVSRTEGQPGTLPDPARLLPERDPASLKEDPVAQAYRKLSWALDVDPTKHRPAGEALARRVAQGKGLPEILPLVDAYNLASAACLVPFSAFDAKALQGELVLDVAGQDEAFEPIGDTPGQVEPGRPVWRDQA